MDIVLIALIAATVLISAKGFNDLYFFRKYDFHIGSIRSGEQIRMISSGFLHADVMHLAFNMLTLYFFAPTVIDELGRLSFLLVYAVSLVAGSLLTLVLHKDDYSYRAIGASGAVTGILFSAILLDPNLGVGLMFLPGIAIPGWLFGILYLAYSIYGMRAKIDNIGHTAHFGGAIGGYAITLLYRPHIFTDDTFTVIALALPIAALFIMERFGKL
ncbi:rhomboid family intramembrane serine protease [Flavobacterium sp. MAH-1]|uniref:Rhomboid family intramembrane serine protease n=1 Tax=Flavobacterium agri TaxID=2743471 RepID=A0A7Y8Y018_9FLAO|nr:rhomboid family intramembrane serine protease [Flavobacterium agri]NUY79851.1 rhomboid family intramembrane serine protease [Flavobacterium agri]NYA69876.1 rhomboid family intramembrane serine protease [Flavobacterium agri]